MTPVSFDALPGWKADHQAAMLPAFAANCAALTHMPPDQPLGGEGEAALVGGTARQRTVACAAARRLPAGSSDAKVRAYFEAAFQAYRVTDNFRPDPLFTGYCEPELAGDLAPSEDYATPLFGTPPDLLQTTLTPAAPGLAARHVFGRMVGHRLAPYYDIGTI